MHRVPPKVPSSWGKFLQSKLPQPQKKEVPKVVSFTCHSVSNPSCFALNCTVRERSWRTHSRVSLGRDWVMLPQKGTKATVVHLRAEQVMWVWSWRWCRNFYFQNKTSSDPHEYNNATQNDLNNDLLSVNHTRLVFTGQSEKGHSLWQQTRQLREFFLTGVGWRPMDSSIF